MQALLTLFAVVLISTTAMANDPADHLQQAKVKYPNSLIGDDHGVLSEQDLAISTCDGTPAPFDPSTPLGGLYWKCFETKKVSALCDSNGKADEHEGVMGFIVLTAEDGDDLHDYIARRALPIQVCHEFTRDVRKRLRGTHYACIMGSDPSMSTRPPERAKIDWIFEAVRTKRGCESYFQQCDLDDLVKNGQCKPHPLLGPIRLPPDRAFWRRHKTTS
jgi:hypothetical protein